jgi:succinoglycan biosynthesis protein ExoL
MKDIVFIISYLPLGRILRRLKTASGVGNVAVICWNRMLNNKIENKVHESIEQVVISQKSAEGKPIHSIFSMAIFTLKAISCLIRMKPKVIHVELLNMLIIAFLYKVFFSWKVQIIYEVSDLHSIIIDKHRSITKKVIGKMLFMLDKFMCKFVKLVIVTSIFFIDEYFSKFVPKKKLLFIPNSPEEGIFDEFEKKTTGVFTVGFIGYVRYKHQLEMLIRVSQKCDINVLIAGTGTDYQYLFDKYNSYPNVIFYGPYQYEKEIKRIYGMVDCVYSVYDTSLRNVQVALPNKLYESILCELPILVAKNTKLADLVTKWGVGVEVSDTDENELMETILKLKCDSPFYNEIVNNCKKQSASVNSQNSTLEYVRTLMAEIS